MNPLPQQKSELPAGAILEKPPFVPRMVMTPELQTIIKEVLHQWRHRDQFEGLRKYGIRPLDRLLFYGPPGNGKTMTCYWIARELGIPVYRILCNQLHGSFLGETTRAVADVLTFFNGQRKPSILLWDEVEAIFMKRSHGRSGGDRELCTATTIFLQALDRWESPTLMVLATNLPEKLDEALLSRVEMRLLFEGPNDDQCAKMLEYWTEILCNHGSDAWGPTVAEKMSEQPPKSFRELQQWIAFAARAWTAQKCV